MKNNWIWTELTESLKPERKAGDPVPEGYMIQGYKEWVPYSSWVSKGYVEEVVKDKQLSLL